MNVYENKKGKDHTSRSVLSRQERMTFCVFNFGTFSPAAYSEFMASRIFSLELDKLIGILRVNLDIEKKTFESGFLASRIKM